MGRVLEPPGCELPATWPRSPGIGRPDRAPGQLWSPGVCFLPSLSTLCVCVCVCVCVFSPRLPHGRHPPFLAACSQGRDPRPHPGVAAPAQPLPAVTSSPACPAPAPWPAGDLTCLRVRGTGRVHMGPFSAWAGHCQVRALLSPGGCASHLLISSPGSKPMCRPSLGPSGLILSNTVCCMWPSRPPFLLILTLHP